MLLMTKGVDQFAPVIWEKINAASSVLLHFHPSPDGDSVGSALAMMHVLNNLGKTTTVISGDSQLPPQLAHLPGFERVKTQNLLQTDLSAFDLFVIVDSGSLSQITRLGPVVFPASLSTVSIDHHDTNSGYAQVNWIDDEAPAVSLMLYDLFTYLKLEITPEIAANLFMGIHSDTGGFQYTSTTPHCLQAAAKLGEIYPSFGQLIWESENHNEPERIRYLGLALSSVRLFFGDRVAVSCVPYTRLSELGISKSHTEKTEIANLLKSVPQWEIGISLVESEPGRVSASFRTRDPEKHNVGLLAEATGYGGGHASASGATFPMTFDAALEFLLKTIAASFPELGPVHG